MTDARAAPRRILAATSVSYTLVLLDASIVNVALQRIAQAFSADVAGLQWVVSAYTLAFASLLLSGGTLGDRCGARRIYLAGLALFTAASLLCGVAPNLAALIAARAAQGVGAALLVPCSLSLISRAYPQPAQRAAAIGLWVGCGGVAMAAGPPLGGLLIESFGWRSIFLLNAPVGLAGIWLTLRTARQAATATAPSFDLAGQLTAMLALGSSIGVLIEAPQLGWHTLPIQGGAVCAVLAWASFLMIEARRRQPMLPLSLFRHAVFSASVFASLASAFVFYGLIFVLSLYFQQARGYSPWRAGLAFLPLSAAMAFGSLLCGPLSARFGQRWPMCGAFGLYLAGLLLLSLLGHDTPYALAAIALPPIGLAAGFISPAATAPAMGTVEPGRAGVAAGVLNAARQSGAALGIAVCGSLLAAPQGFAQGMRDALWIAAALAVAAALAWAWTLAAPAAQAAPGGNLSKP